MGGWRLIWVRGRRARSLPGWLLPVLVLAAGLMAACLLGRSA